MLAKYVIVEPWGLGILIWRSLLLGLRNPKTLNMIP
jgi:hypothetical protein